LRIDVAAFVPSKTQRRVWRHGSAELRTEIDVPRLSAEKVALYNRHKGERGLLVSEHVLDADGYRDFLVSSCAETIELRYRQGGRLVAVAIADVASNALSAVYCYFDPGYSRLSPGTYSILRLLELCRTWELQYLYLGLYVEGCATMAYKATYLPHERLIAGRWRRFEHPDGKVPTA
jgi:arginyl-tRNA--protein-N-Asp/Glu arginylyltransferase